MTSGSLARRGFTLVELLLSLVVSAIIGAALVRMVLSQARFMDQQEAWREARSVSRGGINRLLSDLRAVQARWIRGGGCRRTGFYRPGALRLRHRLRPGGRKRLHREPPAGGCHHVCREWLYRICHER